MQMFIWIIFIFCFMSNIFSVVEYNSEKVQKSSLQTGLEYYIIRFLNNTVKERQYRKETKK